MKNTLLQSVKLTLLLVVLFAFIYPLFISAIALFAPGKGNGVVVTRMGKMIGYANIGQKFTDPGYFHGRPSAVDYNAAGSAGSNKGTSNTDYLKTVQERIDTFLLQNPGVKKEDIPADIVTASGSGLDPHISPQAAFIQIKRISAVRHISEDQLKILVTQHTQGSLLGLFGPSKVNVLQVNIALDSLNKLK